MGGSSPPTEKVGCKLCNSPKILYSAYMAQSFKVTAVWDDEAKVFTSTSNIPGLVVEADTFEEFVSLVEVLAPQMLAANEPQIVQT
jgi:Domain of unknown function (DUF1902)